MDERLPRVNGFEALAAFQRDGWTIARRSGHVILRHPTKPGRVPVPMHRQDLAPGTLRAMIRQAGLTVAGFNALL